MCVLLTREKVSVQLSLLLWFLTESLYLEFSFRTCVDVGFGRVFAVGKINSFQGETERKRDLDEPD